MRVDDLPDLLTVPEAADFLRIGRTTAYAEVKRWRATGGIHGIPVVNVGRSLRVPKAALLKLALVPASGSGADDRP